MKNENYLKEEIISGKDRKEGFIQKMKVAIKMSKISSIY